MKKVILLTGVIAIAFACKSKQKAGSTTANNETSNPAAAAVASNPDLENAAKKRYPNVAYEDIATGEKLYNGKCGRCHGLPEIESRTEEKWPKTIDWMAPKANLTETEKAHVLKYVLCALDVKTKK